MVGDGTGIQAQGKGGTFHVGRNAVEARRFGLFDSLQTPLLDEDGFECLHVGRNFLQQLVRATLGQIQLILEEGFGVVNGSSILQSCSGSKESSL